MHRKSISASGYKTFLLCPQKYNLRYLRSEGTPKPPDPKNPDLLAGDGVHAAIEHAVKQSLLGTNPTVEDCIAAGVAKAMAEVVANGFTLGDGVADLFGDKTEALDRCFDRVRRAAGWFLLNEFENLRPLESERHFDVCIPGTDWTLNGRLDLVQYGPTEKQSVITDFKLSARAPSIDKADRSTQLSIYALAHWLATGEVPAALELYYIIDSTRCHSLVRTTHRTVEQCKQWLARIQQTVRSIDQMISAGLFLPCDPETLDYGKPVCSNGRCAYFGQCPHGGLYGI